MKIKLIIVFIIIAAIAAIIINRKNKPCTVYPLSPSTTSFVRLYPLNIVNKISGATDTIIYRCYILDGYFENDTAVIKNIIFSYLYHNSHSKIKSKIIDLTKNQPKETYSESFVDLKNRNVKYFFEFYKAGNGLDKGFIETPGEYGGLGEFKSQRIVEVHWDSARIAEIIFFRNSRIIYSDTYLFNGNIIKQKFKDGLPNYEDEYTPLGIIRKHSRIN